MKRLMLRLLFSLIFLALYAFPGKAQTGASMTAAVNMGNFSDCGSPMFYDSRNSASYAGTTYTNSIGQPSPEVYYRFTVVGTATLDFSLCQSDYDTYIHILNSGGTILTSQDDSPDCGTRSHLSYTFGPGTYYLAVEGYSTYTGNIGLVVSSVNSGSTPGAKMSSAINAGTFNSSGSFTDTKSNADICLGDDIGQPNNDIYYKFVLSAEATVSLSHCGSGFDTYMHLLDALGNVISFNDDNASGPCPGGQAYIQKILSAGTYYLVSEGYGNYTGNIVSSINVVMAAPTGAPVIAYNPNNVSMYIGSPVYLSPVNTGGAVNSSEQTTSTLAGSGSQGFVNGVGSSASFYWPTSIASDQVGNVYVGDAGNNVIRKITTTGVVSTFAGTGVAGSADGPGATATFSHPAGLTIDASGNLYVSDQYNHKIRKITPAGVVSTFAGNGSIGSTNGIGTAASFNNPTGLLFDGSGNLFVCDFYNHMIRKITPSGTVTTFAGNGTAGFANGNGTAAMLNGPMGISKDASGNFYIADRLNYRIRKMTSAGDLTTFAGSGVSGATDGLGTIASFNRPTGIAIDASGNLYVTDENNCQIRKITPSGLVSNLAGATLVSGTVNGTGSVVRFYSPYAISIDGQGNLYVAQLLNHVIRKVVIPRGYSISPGLPEGLIFDSATGTISGTPTSLLPWTTYTVTASNSSGNGTTTINLQISNEALANINSIQSKTYDDDGILTSENKTYYNNDGKILQSQVKNLSANQVLASEVLYDALGRAVGSTLAAPTNSSELKYKDRFITSNWGVKYDYNNFDLEKTDTPDPVGNSTIGTLGWYYSNNNTMEPYVASTAYPYTRSTIYNDGTEAGKKQASVGEVFKMGSGYQSSSNTLGVVNELSLYSQLRNKFFSESVVGEKNTLKGNAMLNVVQDVNGRQAASITDLDGRVLMTARVGTGSDLVVTDTINVSNQSGYEFLIDWNENGVNPSFTPYINVNGGTITVLKTTDNWATSTNVYTGPALGYNSGGSTQGKYKITSTESFQVSYQVPANNIQIAKCRNCDAKLSSEGKTEIRYFRLFNTTTVNITGTGWKLYNMSGNEQEITSSGSSISLNAGYYKVSIPDAGSAMVVYSTTYSDISFNFYGQQGQLLSNIAPEGVKAILTNGVGSYGTLSDVPFNSIYEYDIQGKLIASTETDGGRTESIYRTYGGIRFSQNSLQRNASPKRFSYVNYDRWGRTVESGEFIETANITFSIAKTNEILQNNVSDDGGLIGTKSDWVKIHYDNIDNSHGVPGYTQNEINLRSSVSWTENSIGSKTWFNYDDHGRLLWMIRSIPGLGNKTIDYNYDAKNNISKVDYQKNLSNERFVHEYDYDADNRLKVVYTSTATSGRKEQARYYYYLHGPLKRIQLANDLQGIDYVYTAQGTLKSINHPISANDPGKDGVVNSISPDAFGLTLEYFNGDYIRNGTGIASLITGGNPNYSGSIMGQSWRSQKPQAVTMTYGAAVNNPAMLTYAYDGKYQFDNSKYGVPNFGSNSFTETVNVNREYGVTYDANGNIRALTRTNSVGGNIANYTYSYIPNTNKLSAVSNYTTSYTYDELGQINSQIRTGGAGYYLNYDAKGKVVNIYSNASRTTLRVSFVYDESGNRIQKTDHILNTITYYIYDTAGNLLATYDNKGTTMQQKELLIYAGSKLGIYNKLNNNYQYELTDHLGNVRVVLNGVKQSNGQADVIYYSDYYPFGSPMTLATSDYRYGYQGQYSEVDKETGWNNFDLRMYDPAIGRWMTKDPAGQFYSPYVGMGNDPISSVDPDGAYTKTGATIRRFWALVTFQHPGEVYQSGTSSKSWGYNTGEGPGINFHVGYSNGLSADQQRSMGLRNYGGDYSNSAKDWFYYLSNEWINKLNPFANLWDVGTGVANGTDRFGNPQGSVETNLKFVSVLFSVRAAAPSIELPKISLSGGPTFAEYRAAYWADKTKPVLDPLLDRTGTQSWSQYIELHHRFIPQRASWAPNWLKNNSLNLQPLSSLEHALADPYRARFAPAWVKDAYNLKWK